MTPHRGPIESPRRLSHPAPPTPGSTTDATPATAAPRARWGNSHKTPHRRWVAAEGSAESLERLQALWSEDELAQLMHETAKKRGRPMSRRKARTMVARARRRHGKLTERVTQAKKRVPLIQNWRPLCKATCICALAGCFELALAAFTAPQFSVRQITADPSSLPPAAVGMAQAKLSGQNWLTADVAPVVSQLKSMPVIEEVSVRRELSWPPSLHIALRERQPFARVSGADGWWVVDEKGVPFRKAVAADSHLYAISSRVFEPVPGKPLLAESWKSAREFAAVLSANGGEHPGWKLRAIYFDDHGFASLRLTDTSPNAAQGDSILVHLGDSQWDKKLIRAQKALRWLASNGQRASALSLVSYRRPVWTPRGTAQPDPNSPARPA